MKLKMCSTSKIFGEIYLKAISDTFFQHNVCNQGSNGVRLEGKWEYSIFWWGSSKNIMLLKNRIYI